MGNSPSSHEDAVSSSSGADEIISDDTSSATTGEKNVSSSSSGGAKSTSILSPTKSNFRGTFNPNISIQTLGSGGPGDDAGVFYNLENPTSTVGQSLGAALVGGGGANNNNQNNISGSGDVILSSLPKDLNSSNLGGRIVAIQRLLPGSGRMMRSYRMRVRVAKIDNNYGSASKPTTANNNDTVATTSDNNNRSNNGVSAMELACKSFIVRSEKGESPLRLALTEGDAELKRLRTVLSDPSVHPHILSYSRWLIGPSSSSNSQPTNNFPVARPIYLIRQHAHASLCDRLFSRPFLTLIEKNWITYQLLRALQSLHDAGVCHGHLTTENILLTSWNWVLISDVGCQHFKPVALPDDDPGLWIHWFEGRGDEQVKRESWVGHHHRGGDKKCYLAPERFYTPGCNETEIQTELTPANDIFSLGCVLIELFLGGERALDLGDLMEYRRQGKDSTALPQTLKQKLDKIESSKMRAACKNMMSLDPSARLTPIEYLERLSSSSKRKDSDEPKAEKSKQSGQHSSTVAPIPTCFQSALYPFMLRLRTEILSPDARIALVACNYGSILKATVGVDDDWGDKYFSRVLGPTLRNIEGMTSQSKDSVNPAVPTSKGPSTASTELDIGTFSLDKLLMETEMLLRQLDSGVDTVKTNSKDSQTASVAKVLKLADNFTQCTRQPSAPHSSLIVLLQVVFSTVRHVQRASSKFVALQLMHRIALFSSDEIRLQRIVPLVTSLLQDSEPIVRSSSISVLASVLATVTSFPPSDAQIFPKYVFKKVAHLITDASLIVRVAFAKNIAILAETALRFLDVGHSVSLYEAVAARQSLESSGRGESNEGKTRTASAIFPEEAASLLGKQKGASDTNTASTKNTSVGQRDSASTSTTTIKNTYDSDLAVLQEVVFRWFIHITTDTSDHSSQSKQALLSDLPRLCTFFRAEYSFQLLPIVLAFLNDRKDWQLRAALCRHLPSVCVSVGRAATEQFVIPCIETALNDEVEKVIIEALNCLSTLISLSLLTRVTLLGNELAGNSSPRRNESPRRSHRKKQGVVKKCAALLMNPSPIVRQYAGLFIISCWKILDETDSEVFLNMLLRPYLRFKPTTFESMSHLFACVKPPQPKKNMTTDALAVCKSNIDTEIEISAKLASILSVPNIQSVELVSSCIPMWYETMMRSSLVNQALSPSFLSLGFVLLRQVYALNIEEPVCTSNRILCCNANNKKASEMIKNNAEINEQGITNIMASPDVKAVEAAVNGEWGSAAVIDQTIPENGLVHNKIQPLNVPPLPPRLGVANTYNADTNIVKNWSPKEDNMIGTTSAREHSGPVNRLSVSADQSFFASACFDGTSKVFELRQVQDSGGEIHSCITYDGHKKDCENVRINDVTILKNSHTVATAASDGSLHVWRVDMVSSKQQSQLNNQSPVRISRPRVSGHCAVRTIDTEEGELLSVKHFNTPSASILTYATQRGNIHSLDLRCGRQPFSLHMRPELGYLTDMEVGNDKNWIVAGTSRGFIGLWDIRFQTMVKLWRHSRDSSIRRLTNAFGHETNENFTRPLVFMGCDNNEASLFDVSTGDCRQCYRVLDSSFSYVDQSALPLEYLSKPYLESVNIRSRRRIVSLDKAIQMSTRGASLGVNVNALVPSINRRGKAFLVTGGSDHMIRYWDLHTSSKSYVVSGLARHQPPAEFESVKMGGESRLILCRQPSIPPANLVESAHVPSRSRQGMAKGDGGNHRDAILDLKLVKYPQMGLLSSSRDGTIKLFC